MEAKKVLKGWLGFGLGRGCFQLSFSYGGCAETEFGFLDWGFNLWNGKYYYYYFYVNLVASGSSCVLS